MGRTIPSFRIAAERELVGWRRFRRWLSGEERRRFDGLVASARLYTSASSSSLRTSPFEAVAMALLLHHHGALAEFIHGDAMSLTDGRKVRSVIDGWSGFAWALRESDRERFEGMMERCLEYSQAIEAMGPDSESEALIMSILLAHEKALYEMRKKGEKGERSEQKGEGEVRP